MFVCGDNGRVAVTETIWPAKPKILSGPVQHGFSNCCLSVDSKRFTLTGEAPRVLAPPPSRLTWPRLSHACPVSVAPSSPSLRGSPQTAAPPGMPSPPVASAHHSGLSLTAPRRSDHPWKLCIRPLHATLEKAVLFRLHHGPYRLFYLFCPH